MTGCSSTSLAMYPPSSGSSPASRQYVPALRPLSALPSQTNRQVDQFRVQHHGSLLQCRNDVQHAAAHRRPRLRRVVLDPRCLHVLHARCVRLFQVLFHPPPPARWLLRALVRGPLIRESKNFEYGDDRIDGAAQSRSLESCVDGRGDWCRALDFYSDAPACSASEWRHAVRHGTLCRAGKDTSQHSPSVFCGYTRGSSITDNPKRTPVLYSLEVHPCQNRARFPCRACTTSLNDGLVLWIDICASECSQARDL